MSLPYPPPPKTDFGFGTAYERVAIYEMIDRWLAAWGDGIRTGAEGFHDGFTGLPGLHLIPLARRGGKVAVACVNPTTEAGVRAIYQSLNLDASLQTRLTQTPADFADEGPFDVVMLFNPFPYTEDWRGYLAQAAKLSRNRLIVSVANANSYGALFRRVMKTLRPTGKVDLFDHPATNPANMRAELSQYGTIETEDFFDCPWWPDLFVEAGDSIASWLISQIPFCGKRSRPDQPKPQPESPSGAYLYGPGLYPFFTPNSPDLIALKEKIKGHPTFDHWKRGLVKEFFGHHRIFVVRRPGHP